MAAAASVTATAGSRCARRSAQSRPVCFAQRHPLTAPSAAAPHCAHLTPAPFAPLQRERSGGPLPDFGPSRDGREREPGWDPPPPFGGAGKRGRYDDRGSPRFGPPGFQPPPERGGSWYDGAPRHFGRGEALRG